MYAWHNGSCSPTRGLFVLLSDDVYISHGNGEMRKSIDTMDTFEIVKQFCDECYAIFITINNVIYCSMETKNFIVTKSLDSKSDRITVIAGTSVAGHEAHMLYCLKWIFININLDLYVADSDNNRIQKILFLNNTCSKYEKCKICLYFNWIF